MSTVLGTVGLVLLLLGCLLGLVAAIGLVRFPDTLSRMHAATKPQTLGLLLVLAGVGLRLQSWPVTGVLLLVAVGQALTAPVAAHMVGRAAYRSGQVDPEVTSPDELSEALRDK